jgi:hypothetical protein
VKFAIETITPREARRLLDRTEALGFTNRAIVRSRVDKLAHAIVSGQWRITHQGIAIGEDGAVLDGQHRLRAIIAADTAVETLVVHDADPETFRVVDTGAARTTADTLRIQGHANPNVLSAMVRGFIVYDALVGTTENFSGALARLTTTDVTDFLDDPKRRDATHGALLAARSVAGQLARYGLSTSLGVAMMECRLRPNELGKDTTAEFFARLADGTMLAPSSPILSLRRWLMADTGYSRVAGQYRRPVAISATIKCLNDFALGRDRLIVSFRLGQEPYPAPLPRGTRRRIERDSEQRERELAAEEES